MSPNKSVPLKFSVWVYVAYLGSTVSLREWEDKPQGENICERQIKNSCKNIYKELL